MAKPHGRPPRMTTKPERTPLAMALQALIDTFRDYLLDARPKLFYPCSLDGLRCIVSVSSFALSTTFFGNNFRSASSVVRSDAFLRGLAMSEFNLPELIERFGSEDKCHAYLEELRWPDGVRCPRCESDKISRITKRRQFDCDACRYQFSVRVGTIFHDSKLPLWKWFLAVYMMAESKKGVSANQLKRMLGVSYKTAWYLCHRIRSTMKDDGAELLRGIVEADETYIGGKRSVPGNARRARQERMANKTTVLGAIERGGKLRVRVVADSTKETIHAFLGEVVADDAEAIYTDSHRGYRG